MYARVCVCVPTVNYTGQQLLNIPVTGRGAGAGQAGEVYACLFKQLIMLFWSQHRTYVCLCAIEEGEEEGEECMCGKGGKELEDRAVSFHSTLVLPCAL